MNVMSFIKIVKKSMSRICCCSGCLKLATSVFGIIDIVISAFVIFITVTFLYSYRIKINLDLLDITSANNLKNIILDISIVIHSCNIITCMLLLYGNHSGRRNFLCPYVIMGFIRLMGIFLIIILLIFSGQWQLLLNCLCGMVYAICSLHVVGERDKELANQLASKLKSLNPSAPASPTSAADIKKETLKIKEYTKPITPEEAKQFTKSMKMTAHNQKNKKENKELPFKNTKNNKPSQSLLSISSNTFTSTVEFSSDNPDLSHLPLLSQISRSPLSESTSRHRPESTSRHRPKSSISLTSLNAVGSESVDPLLSKSVSAVYFSAGTSPRSISSCLLSGSTIYIIENGCEAKHDTCKEIEINVMNEPSCKLCKICPSSFVNKGNARACDIQKKIIFDKPSNKNHEKHSPSEDTISQNSYAQNPTHSSPYITAQIGDNKDHGFNSKQIEPCGEKKRVSMSSSTHSLPKPSIMETGLQIEFDEKYSTIQGLDGVSDNIDNSCKFSQILLGEHEIDTTKFDSCSPVKNMC